MKRGDPRTFRQDRSKAPVILDVPSDWTLTLKSDGSKVRIVVKGIWTHAGTMQCIADQLRSCAADVEKEMG